MADAQKRECMLGEVWWLRAPGGVLVGEAGKAGLSQILGVRACQSTEA